MRVKKIKKPENSGNQKISLITLGCSKNTVDSERLMKQLELNNFTMIDSAEKADTVILNTCGFIEAAKQESINEILKAVRLKKKGKISKVIVTGCLSERFAAELRKEIPEVDAYFGTEKYEEVLQELGGELKYELLGERHITTPGASAYLKISEGCDNPCSFCAIPLMRGKHKSKSIDDLVREAGFLAANNTKELVIIGQDTTDYGIDLYGKRNLDELLEKLTLVKGIEWVRLMYAYPSHFPESAMEMIASNPKVCNYIDIPLQHISDSVLKSMRRGITKRRSIELLETLRKKIPSLTLRTTFITGYPTEKEEDFKELMKFVEDFRFERLGVFTYSVEESTTAFILGDTIPDELKEERKDMIMQLQQNISSENNSKKVGNIERVLIDSIEGEYYTGRTESDAPEVDCEVLIPVSENLNVGNFYNIDINDCDEYDLFGNLQISESIINNNK